MKTDFEILLPGSEDVAALLGTAKSLAAQTDRGFSVLLGGEGHAEAGEVISAAGIAVRKVNPPAGTGRVEMWNWLHDRSAGEWVKLLLAGEQLKPLFVERCRQRIRARPGAQLLRVDVEVRTEWGMQVERAPFGSGVVDAAGFAELCGGRLDWISRTVNLAYRRAAWAASGGYAVQLPARVALNLHVILGLHYGIENVPEALAVAGDADAPGAISSGLETWLVLRQARNYCAAMNLPWRKRWVWPSGLAAALGRR